MKKNPITIGHFRRNPRHAVAVFVALAVSGYLMFSVVLPILAAPPTSVYMPGETLNPSCAPGDTNCTVASPATGTASSTQFAFWTTTSSIAGNANLTYATSTGILSVSATSTFTGNFNIIGIASSSESRTPSSTIGTLTVSSCLGCGGSGSVTVSAGSVVANNIPFFITAASSTLSPTSTLSILNLQLLQNGAFNASGTISQNGTAVLTTSTGLGTGNFASPNISQWTNNSGYITTSSIVIGGTASSTFNLGTNLAISSTGTIGFVNNSGFITTSTGLGVGNFQSTNISQWTNNSGYVTSTGANPTASLGLSAINGTANTFMRSDASPALSQSIIPSWTGSHSFLGGLNFTTATGTSATSTLSVNSLTFTNATGTTLALTAMTSGSIPFAGTGGILTQNNANLFWDNTSNRLGIGTTSPSSTLHIYGTTTSTLSLGNSITGGKRYDFRTGGIASGTFDIYDFSSSTSRLAIDAVGNIQLFGVTSSTELRSPSSTIGTLAIATAGTLKGDTISTTTGANPTASLGLTAVNGSANTFMRSDASPALSQSIAPVWTALHQFSGGGVSTTQLWSASSSFLGTLTYKGDTVSTSTGANPTASLGLSAINGTANTFMRSDASPALSQSIIPSWTGSHSFLGGLNFTTATGTSATSTLSVNSGTFANASTTNITASGYGVFPTLNFTNASGTNQTLSGYLSVSGALTDAGGNKYSTSTGGSGAVSTSSAITAGYFPYWVNATGGLNGTSTIFLDTANLRLGIGTEQPSSTLHVSGETTLASQLRISSGTVTEPGIVFSDDDDATGTGFYRVSANVIGVAANGGINSQFSGSGASGIITIGGANGGAGTMNLLNNAIQWEGSSADASETVLQVVNPTADITYQLQNLAAGTYNLAALEAQQTFSSSTFFTGDNVGIGTAQPSSTLHVVSTSTLRGLVLQDGVDPTKQISFNNSNIDTATIRTLSFPNSNTTLAGLATAQTFTAAQTFNGTNNTFGTLITMGTDAPIAFSSNGATRPQIRYDSTQTPDTGMLLTGSVSNNWVIAEQADETFDFAHPVQTNPTLFINSAATSTNQWLGLSHDGSNGIIFTGSSTGIQFNASGTVVSTFTGGGLVGIGTAQPSSTLHIYGTTTSTLSLGNSITGGKRFDFRTGGIASGTLDIYDFSSSTSRFVIDAAGNIGIGTSSPTLANGSSNMFIDISGSSNPGVAIRNTTANQQYLNYVTSVGLYAVYDATNNANRMSITTGGNIAIGDVTPVAHLEISGTGQASTTIADSGNSGATLLLRDSAGSANSGGDIRFGGASASSSWFAAIKGLLTDGSSNSKGDLMFATRNAGTDTGLTERMRITAGGFVGIGTTQPSSTLHISGANSSIISLANTLTGGKRFDFRVGAVTSGTLDIYDFSSSSSRLFISPSGNVGIGTTSTAIGAVSGLNVTIYDPNTSSPILELAGSRADGTGVRVGQMEFIQNNNTESATKKRMAIILSDTEGSSANDRGGNLQFFTKPDNGTVAERMRITESGFVGINTSFPSSTFHVNATCTTFQTDGKCTDYAEYYPASEAVEPGDVLSADTAGSSTIALVRRAASSSRAEIVGIVSSYPAVVVEGNSVQFMNGANYTSNPLRPAVALAGRVPVKVSLENGPIKIGDPLTASSEPGVAMRQTDPGMSIGVALEELTTDNLPLTTSTPKIVAFVNTGFSLGVLADDGGVSGLPAGRQGVAPTPVPESSLSRFAKAVRQAIAELGVSIRNGIATVKELFADTITAKKLCLDDLCIEKPQLQQILEHSGQQALPTGQAGSEPASAPTATDSTSTTSSTSSTSASDSASTSYSTSTPVAESSSTPVSVPEPAPEPAPTTEPAPAPAPAEEPAPAPAPDLAP